MTALEDQLVGRAVAGDADALSVLLDRHGPVLERKLYISPTWRAVLEPADVMQVTYLEAFLHIGRLAEHKTERFVTWLRQIAENNVRDAIRGLEREKRPQPRDRVQAANDEDSLTSLYNVLGATSMTPSKEINRREMLVSLRAAVDSLPRSYADAIRLYDLDGLPIADVAQKLNRSPGAVHMLRARALDQLRRQLGWESAIG
jgi:RNA polymerase sigma-70 factor (ECF subfamily)